LNLNKLRIGLDFDNTLACYDEVFAKRAKVLGYLPGDWLGGKQSVKSELLKMPQGERNWQRLQGQVYGPTMDSAVLFSGVTSFLIRAKQKGYRIFIVSHKTKFGHQDETKTPLREKALQWMARKGFFDASVFGILPTDVHFCDSREEKAVKIKDLEVDIFVDDLECVFEEKEFPAARKILFRTPPSNSFEGFACESWPEVSQEVLGTIEEEDCKALLQGVLDDEIKDVQPIQSGANSKVFRFCNSLGKHFLLKLYPDRALDNRPRLETEMQALESLRSGGMTPEPIALDLERNLSVLEFLSGERPREIGEAELNQALSFLKMLHELPTKVPDSFELASEACLSAEEIERQIRMRLGKLQRIGHHKLLSFLNDVFSPLLGETLSWAKSLLGKKSSWSMKLPRDKRTLSPGDFGFHNSIQDSFGKLKFIDLEYFGWDDPAKLIAEFMLHPGMNLSQESKDRWLEGCLSIFEAIDRDLPLRLQATTPLYALRFALITLNPFLRWQKNNQTSHFSRLADADKEFATGQILKAEQLCSLVKSDCLPSYA